MIIFLITELKKRSPLLEKKKEPPPPRRNLTEEEAEYLEFFTDFCIFTDDPKKYGIDNSVHQKVSLASEETVNDDKIEEQEEDTFEVDDQDEQNKETEIQEHYDRLQPYRKILK